MILTEYDHSDVMMPALAALLAADLRAALDAGPRATFVVPGGTTPGPIFDVLAQTDLDWSRVDVMLSDERWVAETSDRSNTKLLRDRLLTGRAAAARYIPLYAPTEAPEDSLEALQQGIAAVLPISVLLLGMGADMHTASLFPGADLLDASLAPDAPVLLPMRAPGAPEPRMTLTAPVLAEAAKTHIVIKGDDKRAALHVAQNASVAEAPVACVLPRATVHWTPA